METKTFRHQGEPIGGAWLLQEFGLKLVQPLVVESEIGPRRQTVHHPSHRREC